MPNRAYTETPQDTELQAPLKLTGLPWARRLHQSASSAAYATQDAARVGEGLYPQLVEAACLLAIDASPPVAHAGRLALRTAEVELIPVSTAAASSGPATSLASARELLGCSEVDLFRDSEPLNRGCVPSALPACCR